MVTLLVGVLVVVVGAVAIGAALFGPRPVPQPATAAVAGRSAAETPPSAATDLPPEVLAPLVPTARTRVRAALWLLLGVVGTAAIVGAVLGLVALVGVTFVG
ncbi:MAG: hypothetical protein ACKO04_10470 [Actinomycetes bacterium]